MMGESGTLFRTLYKPDRKKGLLLYGTALFVCTAAGITSFLLLLHSTGGIFVVWLLLFLAALVSIPVLGISLYGLLNAFYRVTREGIRLRWGMREVFIPMEMVEWVQSAESVTLELHFPRWSWSGIVRGVRSTRELGVIEYMADDPARLLLLATPDRVFALSPRDDERFVRAIQHAMESGNLSPVEGFSFEPSTFVSRLWEDHTARGLVAAGIALNLALLVVANLIIPQRIEIVLGGQGQTPIPSTSLLLLSMMSIGLGVLDFVLGVNFYRKMEIRMLSYLLWGTSALLPFLLTLAVALAVR